MKLRLKVLYVETIFVRMLVIDTYFFNKVYNIAYDR